MMGMIVAFYIIEYCVGHMYVLRVCEVGHRLLPVVVSASTENTHRRTEERFGMSDRLPI